MRVIPFGYRIENGIAVVDEEQAAVVRELFNGYISGLALMNAAEKAGMKLYHGSAGRMLRNTKYLGDGYYPPIIDQETFDQAEAVRISRAKALGRIRELEARSAGAAPIKFTMAPAKKLYDDPFMQAAYAYSLIESEVETDGSQ